MKFLRNICIIGFLFFAGMSGVFADNKAQIVEEKQEKTTLEKTINNYILEVYKFQGNKILQDLDSSLAKVAPTKEAKIEAYSNIQETLLLKKKNIEKDKNIGKNSKLILMQYLDHMVKEINNRKSEL